MNVMLLMIFLITLVISIFYISGKARADSGVLTLYFSWSRNSENIAENVQANTGEAAIKIEPVVAYPLDYNKCLEKAKTELKGNARPEVINDPSVFDGYDKVILIVPNWWSCIPMPVVTLLENGNLTGKSFYLICTHGGGGISKVKSYVSSLLEKKGAKLIESMNVTGDGGWKLPGDIEAWLRKNSLF
ncbi:MAG: hypothetical protein LBE38_05430 [Deltaproteobacteria bacterium]|jgi:flavodoxin|nr:hypothetical protein [Deltaproteobacteria bacterium]